MWWKCIDPEILNWAGCRDGETTECSALKRTYLQYCFLPKLTGFIVEEEVERVPEVAAVDD